jgi:hypothetical protein
MKIYELINTVDENDYGRYFFVNLEVAKIFVKANPEYSIMERNTLDEKENRVELGKTRSIHV